MTLRHYSVHLLIQEEAGDVKDRKVFDAVPSMGTINFVADGDTPREVLNIFKVKLEDQDFRNAISWAKWSHEKNDD